MPSHDITWDLTSAWSGVEVAKDTYSDVLLDDGDYEFVAFSGEGDECDSNSNSTITLVSNDTDKNDFTITVGQRLGVRFHVRDRSITIDAEADVVCLTPPPLVPADAKQVPFDFQSAATGVMYGMSTALFRLSEPPRLMRKNMTQQVSTSLTDGIYSVVFTAPVYGDGHIFALAADVYLNRTHAIDLTRCVHYFMSSFKIENGVASVINAFADGKLVSPLRKRMRVVR